MAPATAIRPAITPPCSQGLLTGFTVDFGGAVAGFVGVVVEITGGSGQAVGIVVVVPVLVGAVGSLGTVTTGSGPDGAGSGVVVSTGA